MGLKALSLIISILALLTCGARADEKRVALVIGISNYFNGQNALKNPVNDARLIATSLQRAGFKLHGGGYYKDLTKAQMETVILEFGQTARNADIAAVYFSGHGAQVNGINYLIPADARGVSPSTIGLINIDANLILNVLSASGARNKIFWLDACRNNPFLPGREQSGGLAAMNGAPGTLIGYATHPGRVASDGPEGGNSPYAKALGRVMGIRGIDIFAMHMEVGFEVMDRTNNDQLPWIAAANVKPYYFFPPDPALVSSAPPQSTPPTVAQGGPDITVGIGGSSGTSVNYIPLAMRFLEEGNYPEARKLLDFAIREDRNNYLPYRYMGFAFLREGVNSLSSEDAILKYRTGFPYLDAAIKAKPEDPVTRRHRGNAIIATYRSLVLLGKPTNLILDDAIRDFRDAEQLDRSYRNVAALGFAYLFKGLYREAIAQFDQAIGVRDSYAAAYSGRCMAYRLLGDSSAALADARRAAGRDSRLRDKPCLTMTLIKFWGFSSLEI